MSSAEYPGKAVPEDARNQSCSTPDEERSLHHEAVLTDQTRKTGSIHVTRDAYRGQESATSLAGESSRSGQALNPSLTTSSPFSSDRDQAWLRKTLLTLDGGGVRGYSSLLILNAIMREVAAIEQELDPHATHSVHPLNRRYRMSRTNTMRNKKSQGISFSLQASSSPYLPCHYFDYIAGTSTGGLIAIMLGRLSMTVDECLEAYKDLSDKVFGHPRHFHIRRPPWIPREKYKASRLEGVIKEIVKRRDPQGHSSTLFFQPHEDMCRTMIIAWQKFSISRIRRPYILRSYRHPKSTDNNPLERNPDHDCKYEIWKVGRATCAAPTYFESVKLEEEDEEFEFIDGGFGANNPSDEAYTSVKQLHKDDPQSIKILVSIGTGKNQEPSSNPRRGYAMYYEYLNAAAKWATDSERTHEVVSDKLRKNADYCRFNVEHGLGKMKLDAWKGPRGAETLRLIQAKTDVYLQDTKVQESIKETARQLVKIRRLRAYRSDLDRWERFCHGVEYSCAVETCRHGEIYKQRQDLKQHLERSHHGDCTPESIEKILDSGKRYRLFPLDAPAPAPPQPAA